MEEIIEVKQADMLQALNRADIDAQVATAHAYPRDINRVLNTIESSRLWIKRPPKTVSMF